MRSYQDAHNEERREGDKAMTPRAPSPATPEARTRSPVRTGSPVKEVAAAAPPTTQTTREEPRAPVADGAAFRTNVTIGVMVACGVLFGIIMMNSGSTGVKTQPRALLLLVDGVNGQDVARAMSLGRAPYLSLLADVGASGQCSVTATSDITMVREALGTAAGGPSVLKSATAAGFSVAAAGAYPLVDEPAGLGCGAISSECGADGGCLSESVGGATCNMAKQVSVSELSTYANRTAELLESYNVVAMRIVAAPAEANCTGARDSALYEADYVVGHLAMAAVERSAATSNNWLVVVAVAQPGNSRGYLFVAATRGGDPVLVDRDLPPYPDMPALADVSGTIARWLDLTDTAAGKARGICSAGDKPMNC